MEIFFRPIGKSGEIVKLTLDCGSASYSIRPEDTLDEINRNLATAIWRQFKIHTYVLDDEIMIILPPEYDWLILPTNLIITRVECRGIAMRICKCEDRKLNAFGLGPDRESLERLK